MYRKKSRQYLERYVMLHECAQHQGVGVGGGCAPSHTDREAEGNLCFKNEQKIQLSSFLY